MRGAKRGNVGKAIALVVAAMAAGCSHPPPPPSRYGTAMLGLQATPHRFVIKFDTGGCLDSATPDPTASRPCPSGFAASDCLALHPNEFLLFQAVDSSGNDAATDFVLEFDPFGAAPIPSQQGKKLVQVTHAIAATSPRAQKPHTFDVVIQKPGCTGAKARLDPQIILDRH